MKIMRIRNKNGFTYLVAIVVLGLLAFMGIFLMQSSTAEYSQTSMSVYRTMGRQLAEAAADEAAVQLEQLFKNKDENKGFFKALLQQAATSGPAREVIIDDDGNTARGETGKFTTFGNDFTDLKSYVTQTNSLISIHVTRAGFSVDSVIPNLTDLRPIPQGPLDSPVCYYKPTDRENRYDYVDGKVDYSKDWYGTLELTVTVSMNKKPKASFVYKISRDFKLVNVGPMARSYTYYSIGGLFIRDYADLANMQNVTKNFMNGAGNNKEEGRLILWNMPFQSRIFFHGPAQINLENPAVGRASPEELGYNYPPNQKGPGANHAFQYSDTFYGFSYFPDVNRCIFPKEHFWQIWKDEEPPKDDLEDGTSGNFYYNIYGKDKKILEYATAVGGQLPEKGSKVGKRLLDMIEDGLNNAYFVGTNMFQKFLPAGPFCRTPWRYLAPEPSTAQPRWNNITAATELSFPKKDDHLRIEHRWIKSEPDFAKNTMLESGVTPVKYNKVTGNITRYNEDNSEFSLSYYNNKKADSFIKKLLETGKSLIRGYVNLTTWPIQALISAGTNLYKKYTVNNSIDAEKDDNYINLFPTNYKNKYKRVATRRLANETQIPLDEEGNWKLRGIYWLDSFNVKNNVLYTGTGTIIVDHYPVEISGTIMADRTDDGTMKGHLNILYFQDVGNEQLRKQCASDLATNDFDKRMLKLKGGVTVEASVFSYCGIKSEDGLNVTYEDLTSGDVSRNFGMDPTLTFDEWQKDDSPIQRLHDAGANMIFGNYIDFYATLHKQGDDLWVVHNTENPFFFASDGQGGATNVQDIIDSDINKRIEYETKTHDFFLSPKIQSIGIKGGSQ